MGGIQCPSANHPAMQRVLRPAAALALAWSTAKKLPLLHTCTRRQTDLRSKGSSTRRGYDTRLLNHAKHMFKALVTRQERLKQCMVRFLMACMYAAMQMQQHAACSASLCSAYKHVMSTCHSQPGQLQPLLLTAHALLCFPWAVNSSVTSQKHSSGPYPHLRVQHNP